jgi:transcriptional regulator with XRE-family HTH domain
VTVGARFGALLKRYRLAAGLTQEALAERAGLSARAVSDLERDPDRLPRLDSIALLGDALGLTTPQREMLRAGENIDQQMLVAPRLGRQGDNASDCKGQKSADPLHQFLPQDVMCRFSTV